MTITFRSLFTVAFETTPQVVGLIPSGFFRRMGTITSGRFAGDTISGRVLPGGGDCVTMRSDGVIHLDVRAMLETSDGEAIYMTYTGRLRSTPDIDARLAAGETIASTELYFRIAVQFETASVTHGYLNDLVAFGIGHRRPQGPVYDVYQLL